MPFSMPYTKRTGGKVDTGDVPTRFYRYGVLEIEHALVTLGYLEDKRADGYFGWWTQRAVRKFQQDYTLVADGIAGESTLGMLFGPLVDDREEVHELPDRLLHAIVMKESRYDPGAYYDNGDSIDRGICMLNSKAYPDLSDAQATMVPEALDIAAVRLKTAWHKYTGRGAKRRLNCTIASYNSPVGASDLFDGQEISAKLRQYIDDVKGFMSE